MHFEKPSTNVEASRELGAQVAANAGYVVARQETVVYQVPYDGTESHQPVTVEEVRISEQRANLVA